MVVDIPWFAEETYSAAVAKAQAEANFRSAPVRLVDMQSRRWIRFITPVGVGRGV